jgi:predicted nucleotidyltransferase
MPLDAHAVFPMIEPGHICFTKPYRVWQNSPMTADAIIATLTANAADLKTRGVLHVALIGSQARGEAKPGSDIDLAVDLLPGKTLSGYDIVGLERHLAELLGAPVDIIVQPVRRATLRQEIEKDAVLAF